MRFLLGKIILWALGAKRIQKIALEPGDSLLMVKPWWVGHQQAVKMASDIGEALGISSVFVLPDGATLANLKARDRVVEDA